MRHLIDGVGFSERAHFDCTEQAFEVVLRYHGYELEDVLFDEWRFEYWRATAAEGGYAIGGGAPIERVQKFAAFGIGLVFRHRDSPSAALEEIKRLVTADRPVAVWVDPYHLKYYARKNRRHTVHAIVVVGFDEEAETVEVVDPSPWQMFRGAISALDLQEAMGSSHHANPGERNSWAQFEVPAAPRRNTMEGVRAVLAANTAAMLVSRRVETGANGAPPGVLQQGVEGIRAFARDVVGWGDLSEARLRAFMEGAREPLRAIARRRYGHARYLASAGRRLDDERLTRAGRALEGLAEAWFLPGNLLFKGSRRRPLETLPKVARRLDELAGREKALLEGLREVASVRQAVGV